MSIRDTSSGGSIPGSRRYSTFKWVVLPALLVSLVIVMYTLVVYWAGSKQIEVQNAKATEARKQQKPAMAKIAWESFPGGFLLRNGEPLLMNDQEAVFLACSEGRILYEVHVKLNGDPANINPIGIPGALIGEGNSLAVQSLGCQTN